MNYSAAFLPWVLKRRAADIDAALGTGVSKMCIQDGRVDFVEKWLKHVCTDEERDQLYAQWAIEKE